MINGIVWFITGGLMGALVSFLLGKTKPMNLVFDIFAGSSGAFTTGLILTTVFGMYNLTLHYLSLPITVASSIGALFWIELINLILT
jgi:uncharacterized membrane protein YeaQ/YmgE (transglycosylase-associated protein family)